MQLAKSFSQASEQVHTGKLPIILLLTKTDMLGERLNMMRKAYQPPDNNFDSSEGGSDVETSNIDREKKLIKSYKGSSVSGKNGAYDDVPDLDSDIDMIVELLEGQFANTIGFSGKAMAVSSHDDKGILEAVA